jgi:hypothetical protein
MPALDNPYVEYIWAQHRIMFLLKQVSLEGISESLREQITSIALTYGLIVDGYTAIVLVAEEPETPTTTTPYPTTYPAPEPTYTPSPTATPTPYTTATAPPPADYSMSLVSGLFFTVVIVSVFFAWVCHKRRN